MRHSQPLLVSHAIDMREALQRNGGMSTIELQSGRAMAHSHIDMAVQVRQGLAFQVQLVVPSDKRLDDIRTDLMVGKERRDVAGTTGNTACATVGHQGMTAADETGMVGSARHRRTVVCDVITEMSTRSTARIDQGVVP
jgi:hypothetical protein